MTKKQWDILTGTVNGEIHDTLPVAFIIDSPWLPNWYGNKILDYFSNDDIWFNANISGQFTVSL